MLNLNPYNILAGLIFGTIGWGAFSFGRKLERTKPRLIGAALMVYPYLFKNPYLLWGAGVVLIILLCFHHD
ncbi:MAG: amino acid transport protein, partial [Verrucomicrobiales bacterium]